MAVSNIVLGPDGAGKKQRTNDTGTPGHDLYMIFGDPYVLTGEYMAASFRQVGGTAGNTTLATIQNTSGAGRVIGIRRLAVDISKSSTAAFSTNIYVEYYNDTGVTPTGGTLATKTQMDSVYPASQANTEIRFPASADGTNTVITHAIPATNAARRQSHPTNLSIAAAQWQTDDLELIQFGQDPLILRPGETGLVNLTAVTANHFHYCVKIIWEEFTEV